MKTEETIYDSNKAAQLDSMQGNKKDAKPSSSAGVWKEAAVGGGVGILFGTASTLLTGAATPDGNEHTQHPLVDEHIAVATCVDDDMSFAQAFAAARAEVGPGGAFEWHGNLYNTYTAEEWNSLSGEDRSEFNSHFAWAAAGEDSAGQDTLYADVADKSLAVATCVDDSMSFSQAFAAARAEVGSGGVFEWHGNLYNTFTAEEWSHMSAGERADFSSELASTSIPSGSSHSSATGSHWHPTQHSQNTPADPPVRVLSYETVTLEDGSLTDVAVVEIDGRETVFFDVDRDGIADVMAVDLNQDGQLDINEMVDIEDESLAMQPFQQDTSGHSPQDELQMTVLSYETVTTEDGSQVDVVTVDVEGRDGVIVDVDRDGTADVMVVDVNQNGQVEDEEVFDISEEHLAMEIFQPENPMGDDSLLALRGEGPDYINTANVDGYV